MVSVDNLMMIINNSRITEEECIKEINELLKNGGNRKILNEPYTSKSGESRAISLLAFSCQEKKFKVAAALHDLGAKFIVKDHNVEAKFLKPLFEYVNEDREKDANVIKIRSACQDEVMERIISSPVGAESLGVAMDKFNLHEKILALEEDKFKTFTRPLVHKKHIELLKKLVKAAINCEPKPGSDDEKKLFLMINNVPDEEFGDEKWIKNNFKEPYLTNFLKLALEERMLVSNPKIAGLVNLVESASLTIKRREQDELPLLHHAIQRGNIDIVNALLMKGANPYEVYENDGRATTPIHQMDKVEDLKSNKSIIGLIEDADAKPSHQREAKSAAAAGYEERGVLVKAKSRFFSEKPNPWIKLINQANIMIENYANEKEISQDNSAFYNAVKRMNPKITLDRLTVGSMQTSGLRDLLFYSKDDQRTNEEDRATIINHIKKYGNESQKMMIEEFEQRPESGARFRR